MRRWAAVCLAGYLAGAGVMALGQQGAGFNVVETTISQTQEALRTGRVTCVDLVRTYQARLSAYDQRPDAAGHILNTVVIMNPDALRDAQACDARVRAKSMRRLEGVVVVVKDNHATAGLQTTGGSLALKGFRPAADATMVRKLREAGAIVLFKSNMAEWAFSPVLTESSIGGITRNPYDLTRVPAGSSGGTAAAVAANLAEVGLGTDTGDSIRGPAADTSLVGIRPTIGLTSRAGIVPLNITADVGGPLARTVADAAAVLSAVAGPDSADPVTAESAGHVEADYTKYLDRNGLRGKKVGVLRRYLKDADPEVIATFDRALAAMKAQGAEVVDPFDVPDYDALTKNVGCGDFQGDVDTWFRTWGKGAPYGTLQEVVDSGLYLPSIEGRLKYALKPKPADWKPCQDVYHDAKKSAFRDAVVGAMDKAGIDAVVYPTWSQPPRKVGDLKSPGGDNNQVLSPQTGMPAITVPMGFTHGNLPAGVQFLGRLWTEPLLIRMAYSFEQGTGARRPPENFGPVR